MSIKIRKYKSGDETQILDLINSTSELGSSSNRELSDWKWKYQKNPYTFLEGIFVAEETSIIGGHVSLLPHRFKVQDNFCEIANLTDAVIHKSHRRKGVFKKILDKILEQFQRGKLGRFDFLYTMPNKNSIVGLRNLGFKDTNNLYEFVRILRPFESARKYTSNKYKQFLFGSVFWLMCFVSQPKEKPLHFEKFKFNELDGFDTRFEEFSKKENTNYAFIRNSEYLNWRYFSNPKNKYRVIVVEESEKGILGYIVFGIRIYSSRKNLHAANIMQFCFLEGEKSAAQSLLSYLVSELEYKLGVDLIRCYVSKSNPCFEIFYKLGFLKYRRVPLLVLTKDKLNMDFDIRTVSSQLSLGDTDHAP